jgi:hypothetical protein
MATLALILVLWLVGLFDPYCGPCLNDHLRPLFPDDCIAYEDGSVVCEDWRLPAYDDLLQL